jgi:hypothetical protein
VGFPSEFIAGHTVLPDPTIGPVSRFNAEGKNIIHKDQPMETAYRQVEWHWTQWNGRYDSEEQSKIVDVPYQRYPRTFVPPPSVQLTLSTDLRGNMVVVTPECSTAKRDELLHTINLMLECFGSCQVFTKDLSALVLTKQVQVNWTILPKGRSPWPSLKPKLKELLSNARGNTSVVIEHRLETINGYGPDFVAVGRAGFAGYIVFGFTERNLFVLESIYTGNATYVFDSRWEELSKLSKAEILNAALQRDRIIHREGWERLIARLFNNRKAA